MNRIQHRTLTSVQKRLDQATADRDVILAERAEAVLELLDVGESQSAIARVLGVTPAIVSRIVKVYGQEAPTDH